MSINQQYSDILNQLKTLSPANDPQYFQTWQSLLQSLLKLNQLAQSLSLSFSSNETIEDVSTLSLPFVVLPFYIAEILQKSNEKQPQIRILHLNQSAGYYNLFLEGMGQLGILGEIVSKFKDRDGNLKLPSNPSDKRGLKVQGFKRRKEISSKLDEAGFDEVKWISDEQANSEVMDEEVQRSLWIIKIEQCVLDSVDQMINIEREIEMLKIAAENGNHTDIIHKSNDQLRQDQVTPALVLGQDRQQLKEQVFKPFHILPSMTVEQFAEIEIQRMHEREERERQYKSQKQNLTLEQKEEQELQQAREWDEFKDDNPRGWGNSQLKPCA